MVLAAFAVTARHRQNEVCLCVKNVSPPRHRIATLLFMIKTSVTLSSNLEQFLKRCSVHLNLTGDWSREKPEEGKFQGA